MLTGLLFAFSQGVPYALHLLTQKKLSMWREKTNLNYNINLNCSCIAEISR